MCRNPDGSFTQAGIVAWGIECNLPDVPGGYVNVANFVCWIKQHVEEVRPSEVLNMLKCYILQVEGEDYLPYSAECSTGSNEKLSSLIST